MSQLGAAIDAAAETLAASTRANEETVRRMNEVCDALDPALRALHRVRFWALWTTIAAGVCTVAAAVLIVAIWGSR